MTNLMRTAHSTIKRNYFVLDRLIFFAGEKIWFYYNKSKSDFLKQRQSRVKNDESDKERWNRADHGPRFRSPAWPGFGPARPEKNINFQARNGPKKIKNKSNIFIAESYMKKSQENQRIFTKIITEIIYGE